MKSIRNMITFKFLYVFLYRTQNRKNIRNRRATSTRLLLSCQANYRSDCRSNSCRTNYISKIHQQYFKHPYIVLSLRLISFADQTIQFNLQYINFTFNSTYVQLKFLDKTKYFLILAPTGFTTFNSTLESKGKRKITSTNCSMSFALFL